MIDQTLLMSLIPSCVLMESFGQSPLWSGRAHILYVETTSVIDLVCDSKDIRIPEFSEQKLNPCPQCYVLFQDKGEPLRYYCANSKEVFLHFNTNPRENENLFTRTTEEISSIIGANFKMGGGIKRAIENLTSIALKIT